MGYLGTINEFLEKLGLELDIEKKSGGKKGISDGRTEIDIANEILKAGMNHQRDALQGRAKNGLTNMECLC